MKKRFIRTLPGFLVVLGILSGCAGTPQTAEPTSETAPTNAPSASTNPPAPTEAQPTAAPKPEPTVADATSDEAIQVSIQQTLDVYAKAYNTNDPTLLQQAVDQSNAPFRRLIQTRFDTYQQSINAGGQFDFKVDKILKQREEGFVVAQVSRNGLLADWTFRNVDGKWLMSEPTNQQLGKREKLESANFKYTAYPWSKDLNPTIIDLMERARSIVVDRLGKGPDAKAEVEIRPTFGSGGISNANVLAYYNRDSRGTLKIVLYTPESYVFGFYDPAVGWKGELLGTLVHEYTHLVNDASFTPIARMSDWMFEGLAEYVSDNPRAGEVQRAVQTDQIIPIIDTSGQVNKQDLEHLTILTKDRSLAYGLSYSLVAYIADTQGGLDGFWKLVAAYDKAQNLGTALQEAFGMSFEQFDTGWREWLKQKYG